MIRIGIILLTILLFVVITAFFPVTAQSGLFSSLIGQISIVLSLVLALTDFRSLIEKLERSWPNLRARISPMVLRVLRTVLPLPQISTVVLLLLIALAVLTDGFRQLLETQAAQGALIIPADSEAKSTLLRVAGGNLVLISFIPTMLALGSHQASLGKRLDFLHLLWACTIGIIAAVVIITMARGRWTGISFGSSPFLVVPVFAVIAAMVPAVPAWLANRIGLRLRKKSAPAMGG